MQSSRHMNRIGVNDLFDVVRPNESEQIKDYRDSVRRDITSEGPWKFINKVVRVFVDNGLNIDQSSLSDQMKEWLNKGVYQINGQSLPVFDFLYQVVLPLAIEDPNAFLVAFPFNPFNESVPPFAPTEEGGLPQNERVGVRSVLVTSKDVRYLDDYILCWVAGDWVYDETNKASAEYFYCVDEEWFYQKVPIKVDKNRVEYILIPWYRHGLGILPAQQLGGKLTKYQPQPNVKGEVMFYYESYLKPFFEYADEATIAFSDNQAIRVRMAYPKTVMDRIPCVNPDCKNGMVRVRDPETGKPVDVETCDACGGSGWIQDPGPYHTLYRTRVPGTNDSTPVLEYISPPTDSLEHSYEVAFDLMKRGKQAIGLDLLENLSESGVAKSLRLEGVKDFLWTIGEDLFMTLQDHLGFVERLLNIEADDQFMPKVKIPPTINFSDLNTLRDEAANALPGDRLVALTSYYQKKYRHDPVMVRIHTLALKWSPLLSMNPQETNTALLIGAYGTIDVIKRDRAVQVFQKIAKELTEEEFLNADEESLFADADELVQPFILQASDRLSGAAPPEFNPQGAPLGEPEPGQSGENK